jgi:hypothetical protein
VLEGAASGSVVGQLFAADANLKDTLTFGVASCAPAAANTTTLCPFVVDAASGAISVAAFASGMLMYDRSATYPTNLTVVLNATVRDNGSPQYWASALVKVLITNILPRFSAPTIAVSIAGNAALHSSVVNAKAGAWSAYDVNGLAFSVTSAFTAENSATPAFVVDASTGLITTNIAATAWNYNTKKVFVFAVTATETNDAAGGYAASAVVTVTLAHANRPPAWSAATLPGVNVPAGATGSVVALSSYLSDPDLTLAPSVGEAITYSISSGNTDSTFAVNNATGIVYVANPSAPSFSYSTVSGAPSTRSPSLPQTPASTARGPPQAPPLSSPSWPAARRPRSPTRASACARTRRPPRWSKRLWPRTRRTSVSPTPS